MRDKWVGKETEKQCLTVLEDETKLHLYGVGALDSLTHSEYQTAVREVDGVLKLQIVIECVRFEHLVSPPVLHELVKYKQLETLRLHYNSLGSFVLLSKLEVPPLGYCRDWVDLSHCGSAIIPSAV